MEPMTVASAAGPLRISSGSDIAPKRSMWNVIIWFPYTGPDLIPIYIKYHGWDFQKRPLVFGSPHAGALRELLNGSSVG